MRIPRPDDFTDHSDCAADTWPPELRAYGNRMFWRPQAIEAIDRSRNRHDEYHLDYRIGFVAGIVARLVVPGPNNPNGFILTTVLGVVGAFVATFIGQTIGWYRLDQGAGLIGELSARWLFCSSGIGWWFITSLAIRVTIWLRAAALAPLALERGDRIQTPRGSSIQEIRYGLLMSSAACSTARGANLTQALR